ncbi:MAG TPA: hypothetical protein VHT96_05450 [Clostridia bacterium]|nr:hypothetical protein [Clostridia bacterium]
MRKSNSMLGGLLVIIGAVLLAARFLFNRSFFTFGADDFWPIIVLLLGAGFELAYYISMKGPGLLVPGGILTTCGVLFFFEVATHWHFAAYTWPVYILAVAIGLFQLYVHIGKPRGLMVAIGILGGIAACSFIVMMFRFFLGAFDLGLVIPVVLVVGGLVMVLGKNRSNSGTW